MLSPINRPRCGSPAKFSTHISSQLFDPNQWRKATCPRRETKDDDHPRMPSSGKRKMKTANLWASIDQFYNDFTINSTFCQGHHSYSYSWFLCAVRCPCSSTPIIVLSYSHESLSSLRHLTSHQGRTLLLGSPPPLLLLQLLPGPSTWVNTCAAEWSAEKKQVRSSLWRCWQTWR